MINGAILEMYFFVVVSVFMKDDISALCGELE